VPVLEQLVLRRLLAQHDSLLVHRQAALRASRDALVEAVRRRLPQWRLTVPSGGLSIWCELPSPRSSALCDAVAALGVRLAPGASFGVEGGLESFVRIPFALPPDVLTDAVDRIAQAWERAVDGPVARRDTAALIA